MKSSIAHAVVLTALAIACQGCEHDISVTFDVTDSYGTPHEPDTTSCTAEYLADDGEDISTLGDGELWQDEEGRRTCVFPDGTDIGWVTVENYPEILELASREDDDVVLAVWEPEITVEVVGDDLVVAWDRQPIAPFAVPDGVRQPVTLYVDGRVRAVDLPATEVRFPLDEVDDPALATISLEVDQGRLTRILEVQ